MQGKQGSPHLSLGACPTSLPVLAAEAEESWRRRGRLAQLLLVLIIPKDQFSDHYLLSHTCRHTSLIQRGFVSYHLRNHYQNTDTICLRAACGFPVMANAQSQKQPWPSCPTGDKVQCSQLIFLEGTAVSLGSFKSVFSLVTEQRLSPFPSQPDRHSYLASQTSPLQHNRRKLFQASDKSHFYLWKSKRSKNTRL